MIIPVVDNTTIKKDYNIYTPDLAGDILMEYNPVLTVQSGISSYGMIGVVDFFGAFYVEHEVTQFTTDTNDIEAYLYVLGHNLFSQKITISKSYNIASGTWISKNQKVNIPVYPGNILIIQCASENSNSHGAIRNVKIRATSTGQTIKF